jgi:hypothetical protein
VAALCFAVILFSSTSPLRFFTAATSTIVNRVWVWTYFGAPLIPPSVTNASGVGCVVSRIKFVCC